MTSTAMDVVNTDGALCGVAIKQKAASGAGNALRVDSDNTAAAAVVVAGAGPLLDLRTAAGTSQMSVSQAGDVTSAGDVIVGAAGKGLKVKEGSNATMGTATLIDGAATVSTTKVTATSRVFLTVQSLGTVAAPKAVAVTARVASTSFTITSADATDTSVVAWVIVEPSA